MIRPAFYKSIVTVAAAAATLSVLSDNAFAHGWGSWGGGGGGGGGGSVPEIDGGSAAAALSLLGGVVYLLKDSIMAKPKK